jgi:hypothetical protein
VTAGFSDEELVALPTTAGATCSAPERRALDDTVAVMRTPVEVTDG